MSIVSPLMNGQTMVECNLQLVPLRPRLVHGVVRVRLGPRLRVRFRVRLVCCGGEMYLLVADDVIEAE